MNSYVKSIRWFVSLSINQRQAEFQPKHVKLLKQKEQIFVYILHENRIKLSHVEVFLGVHSLQKKGEKRLSAIRLSFNYLQDFSLKLR